MHSMSATLRRFVVAFGFAVRFSIFRGAIMKDLTPRQQEVLELIRQAIENTGRPPTRAEIAQHLGFRSANAAEDHLQALARKGAIVLDASTSRGIRLTGAFLESDVPEAPRKTGTRTAVGTAASKMAHMAHSVSEIASQFVQTLGNNMLELPLVGRVAAGSPILAQEHIEASFPVDAALFTEKPDYLLKVRGQSMRDIGILDGDLLAVKRTSQARNGQIVVARVNDDVTVKRYASQKGSIHLLPENTDFQPIVVTAEDNFAIEGLAVGLVRTGQLG